MPFRRQKVDYEAAYIEVMSGEKAIRIVNGRREGMQAVMYAFTGYVGYDGLSGGVWAAMDDRSDAKAEVAKNWLWHLVSCGRCTIEDIRDSD